jgi:hypothetical protein
MKTVSVSWDLDLVEEMAKAIREARFPGHGTTWEDTPARARGSYLREAEAVLNVLAQAKVKEEEAQAKQSLLTEDQLAELLHNAYKQYYGSVLPLWKDLSGSTKGSYVAMAKAILVAGQEPATVSAAAVTTIRQVGPNLPDGIQEWMWVGIGENARAFLLSSETAAETFLRENVNRQIFKVRIVEARRHHIALIPSDE